MIYLSGKEVACSDDLGVMLTFGGNNKIQGHTLFAVDNGCFCRPEVYNDNDYLTWIQRISRSGCLFVVAPDVVGDHEATLQRSQTMLKRIRSIGFKAAFVAQDGAEKGYIPWDNFDALFIGGSTEWKISECAATIAKQAKSHGKWLHMGRVNSLKRMRIAHSFGCDSVDGTYIAYAPDRNLKNIKSWLLEINQQPLLDI